MDRHGWTEHRSLGSGLIALLIGTLILIGPLAGSAQGAGVAGTPAAQASSRVSVTFTPKASPPGCVPFPLDVVHSAGNSAAAFTITITVNQRLCVPVGATAAVYAMPSATVAWPQTIVERKVLTLEDAGTYSVSFAKQDCVAQQFDLISGASPAVTPPVIAPTGPWHGPLLFPLDTSTASQWAGCSSTTTTTSTTSTSTTTTTTTTSSTVPGPTTSTVPGPTSSTVPGPTSSTVPGPTTSVPADVAGETTVAPTTSAEVAGTTDTSDRLAFTGVSPFGLLLGAVLVVTGLVLMMFGRRPITQR